MYQRSKKSPTYISRKYEQPKIGQFYNKTLSMGSVV